MTDRELRRMNREQLLELLVERTTELNEARNRLEEAHERLEELRKSAEADRGALEALRQQLEEARSCPPQPAPISQEAGSIAEAALKVSGIFEDAQRAADVYLENLVRLQSEQASACSRAKAEANEQAQAVRAEAGLVLEKAKSDAERIAAEANGQAQAVRAEAEAVLEKAKSDAERIAAEAERQAKALLSERGEQADRILYEARRKAKDVEESARQNAADQLAEATRQCAALEEETRQQCEEMKRQGIPALQINELAGRVDQIVRENAELRDLLRNESQKKRKWRL